MYFATSLFYIDFKLSCINVFWTRGNVCTRYDCILVYVLDLFLVRMHIPVMCFIMFYVHESSVEEDHNELFVVYRSRLRMHLPSITVTEPGLSAEPDNLRAM